MVGRKTRHWPRAERCLLDDTHHAMAWFVLGHVVSAATPFSMILNLADFQHGGGRRAPAAAAARAAAWARGQRPAGFGSLPSPDEGLLGGGS